MDYGDQGAVRVGLGGVACVKAWPVQHLDAFSVRGGARDSSRPPGGPEKSPVTVSITGFNTDSKTSFKDRFKKRFQEPISKSDFRLLVSILRIIGSESGSALIMRILCIERGGWPFSLVPAGTSHATRAAMGIHFFWSGVSAWAGFRACFLETGLLSACLAVFDPRGFP